MQPATAREALGSFISNNTPARKLKQMAEVHAVVRASRWWRSETKDIRRPGVKISLARAKSSPLPSPALPSSPSPALPCPPLPSPPLSSPVPPQGKGWPQPLPCGAGRLHVFSLGAFLVLDKP